MCVQDQGDSPLRDSKSLTVTTSDVNDLRPIFEPASYSRAIHENITQVSRHTYFIAMTVPAQSLHVDTILCLYLLSGPGGGDSVS